jgi:ferric-dicitrate binding protein FerR (iron transport regulator)
MATRPSADRPDKAEFDEAVAWLRVLWTVPISNQQLTDFFAWSRAKPSARALYDDLSRRVHAALMSEPAPAPSRKRNAPSGGSAARNARPDRP